MTKRTQQIVRIGLFVGTAISLFFVPWILVWAWILPLPASVQGQLEEALEYGFEGVIVYVDQAGQPPAPYAAGWHDRDQQIPAYPQALFKIASIGKLYEAVAVTKLVQAGRLSLEGTLAEYFPELAGRIEHADRITLRMMVQHRSGLPNLTDTPGFWTDPPQSSQEALERVLDRPADFLPGEDYAYSNTNYLLISNLIEQVTGGKSAYFQSAIFAPLGLTHTYLSIHEVDLDELMSGYYVGVEEDIKTADYGSMVATAADVGVFLRALNDGSLLGPEAQELYASLYRYEHTGLIPGYQSMATYEPELDAVVVVFMNTTDFDGYHWNLMEIVRGRVVKQLKRGGG